MKKLFAFISAVFLFSSGFYAQSDVSQLVIPKKIFVGDIAELRYTFRSSIDLFSGNKDMDEIIISTAALPFDIDNADFSVEKAVLQRNGPFYTVVITFIPWKTGTADLPEFDLLCLLFGTSSVPFVINPSPVEVSSILPSGAESSLKPPVPPLLVPGTIYIVYGILFLAVVLLIVLVRLILNRARIIAAFRNRMTVKSYAKNARRTQQALKRLYKKNSKFSDSEYCALFEKIMRSYLSVRFGCRFDSVVSSGTYSVLEKATGGFMGEEKLMQAEILTGLFMRADYVRFAVGSADSRRQPENLYKTALMEEERLQMVEKSRVVINTFESAEKAPVDADISSGKDETENSGGAENA